MRDLCDRYFYRPLPSLPLKIMRVVCGAAMFIHYVRVAPVFLDIFSPKYLGSSPLFPIPHSDFIYYALLAAILMSSFAVIVGWRTRWSLAVLFLGETATTYLDPGAFWSWAFIIRHLLLFLWLAEPWSKAEFAPAWTWRLFQFQTASIYFISQLNRWGNADWLSGDSIFRMLMDGDFSRWAGINWVPYREVLRPLGYFGVVLEWAGAFLVFLGPLQSPVALILIVMHFALQFLASVQVWQPLMIAALLFFMPPSWFSKNKPSIEFKSQLPVAILVTVFFLLSLIHAWPKRLLSEPLLKAQKWISLPLTYTTLYEAANLNMFAYFGPPGRKCLFILSEDESGRLQTVSRDLPKGCNDYKPNLSNADEVTVTVLRMQRYPSIRRRERVGRYLCGQAGSPAGIFAGRIMEWPNRMVPVVYFDCRTSAMREGQPAGLDAYLNEGNFWIPQRLPAPF